MLPHFLDSIAGYPVVYDTIQKLAGVGEIHRRLRGHFARLGANSVIDIGGGTGTLRKLMPPGSRYVCLDIDLLKLSGFVAKHPGGNAVLCDASRAPIKSASMDMALLVNVAHHLSLELLNEVFREGWRILTDKGTFLLVDPLWVPHRWAVRVLWKLDRGSCPRSAETLQKALSAHYNIAHTERFHVFHEYGLFVGVK